LDVLITWLSQLEQPQPGECNGFEEARIECVAPGKPDPLFSSIRQQPT
jgi:hypothetical protein